MNDRELIGVFWATVAAIPVILLIVWGVNRGLDQQERREKLDEITRLGQEIESPIPEKYYEAGMRLNALPCQPDPTHVWLDDKAYESLTAVETADQPSASDSPRRGGGSSFQQEQ